MASTSPKKITRDFLLSTSNSFEKISICPDGALIIVFVEASGDEKAGYIKRKTGIIYLINLNLVYFIKPKTLYLF
jgi:hypothetical protein